MLQHSVLMTDAEFLRSLTVLYVEDDDEVREQLAQFLRRRVSQLLIATNGQEGLATYREEKPDLIITDILMPVMDGLSMAEQIRENDKTTPIVVTTAFERQDYLIRSIDVGIDKYVVKPVRTDQLLAALHKCANVLRSEILLRESEERYRMMFQNFRIGVCIIAPDGNGEDLFHSDGRILDCNQAFLSLSGFDSLEELSRQPYAALVPEEQRSLIVAMAREQLLPQGFMHEYERQFVRRDGALVPALVQSILRRDRNQRPYELWELVTDLTEHKRSQQQLTLAAKVFEGAGEAIMITDGQCRIISVNQAFSRITGYDASDVLGQNPRLLSAGMQSPQFYADMWADIRTGGYWQGEVWNRRKNGDVFPEWLSITALTDVCGQATHYIGIFSDISDRKRAEERIRFLAQHDALTGLPNRLLLRDRLEHAFACADRSERQMALFFIDLDRFKNINDTLGHEVGDSLLIQAAQRGLAVLRDTDTLSRLGGDEFVVVLPDIENRQDALFVARKLLAALCQPYLLAGHELTVSGSAGIALYPDDGQTVSELLRKADAAMYRAKEEGRNTFRFFSAEMNTSSLGELLLENDLFGALERGELEMHYQPKVAAQSGELVGAEALMRWRHREHGMIPPGRFIPLAEENGLITAFGEWAIKSVCAQLRAWLDDGLLVVPVAVNISAHQFSQQDLPQLVAHALAEHGIPPQLLEIELTESMLMRDSKRATQVLQTLRDMHVEVSIDDFGTGYSSLSYLKQFPVQTLKIDRSFVSEITEHGEPVKLAAAIIAMAHELDLEVVAEGVETAEQRDYLREHGCDQFQGYLYGRPQPATDFGKLIAGRRLEGLAD